MKKRLLFILLVGGYLALNIFAAQSYVAAQHASSAATPKAQTTQEKIELIKEKVASKVAELNKRLRYGADGTISKIEDEILTFTADGQDKIITADKDTQLLIRNKQLTTTPAALADFAPKDKVTVIGSEQIGTDLISAKLIIKAPPTVFFTGKITQINKQNFTFTVLEKTAGKENQYIFDYETYTQAFVLNKQNNNLAAGGFSQLKKNSSVQVFATPQTHSETNFTALRLILVPITND